LCRNKENIVKEKNLPKFTDLENLGRYLFVPLQVTNDSQILLNSNYDNLQVINYFKVKAKNLNLNLVLKLHPAEPNHEFKVQIYNMVEQSENIFLSNDNTFSLLDNADFIGVNNSTAGLEAIIIGKNTQFLGKTFYDKLKEDKEFYHYLNQYLVKANFFSGEIYETELLNKIHTLIGFKG
jgi:capsular polysaccharide export protein